MIIRQANETIVETASAMIVDVASVMTADLASVTIVAHANATTVVIVQEATDRVSMIAGRVVERGRAGVKSPTAIILALPPTSTTKIGIATVKQETRAAVAVVVGLEEETMQIGGDVYEVERGVGVVTGGVESF